ncbi:MAG: S41 family peptidase [Oscillospiraceae bacterium]
MIINDIILLIVVLVMAGGLYVLTEIAAKYISPKWRLCYAVPLVFCVVMMTIDGFEKYLLGAYIGSVVMLAGFFSEKVVLRRAASVAAAVGVAVSVPLCLLTTDYRAKDYVGDFEKGFRIMKEHYILTEHKDIDWDALYDEYLPMFRQATAENDGVQNQIFWLEFCSEFNDGHVGYVGSDSSFSDSAKEVLAGNDYGLSMMTLSDGRTVAVNVDETLSAQGIHNGTVILSWDGEKPEALAERSRYFNVAQFADNDNRDFYRAVFAAGVGGDSVSVCFIDDSGAEKTVVLPKLGNYCQRLDDTLGIVNQGLEAGHMTWTELDEETVCLRIKMMAYDGTSDQTEDYSHMRGMIEAMLDEYNDRGFNKLVLDLRGNGGGSGMMVRALAEVFAPEGEHYYCTDGKWDDENKCYAVDENGRYIPGVENMFTGEDKWGGKPVVILVNASSASAADHFVKIMRGFENVTVMGFTKSNGSAQGVGTVALDHGFLGFSSSVVLDKDGSIFVDAGTDGICGNDVDIKVPFDEDAVHVLFDQGGDYVMQKALEYLD